MSIVIGIPKALLYYKYRVLWEVFFNQLGFSVLYSPDTNNEILEDGKDLVVDESCLPLKIYMGHVKYLADKADYILVPRIFCIKKKEKLCTNFNALYDITRNIFDIKILNYNIDVENNETEKEAFIKLGKSLNKKYKEIIKAYRIAKAMEFENKRRRYRDQLKLIKESKNNKILLVSHPYNTYDRFIGERITRYLTELNIDIIYADICGEDVEDKYEYISRNIYWTYNKELLGSIMFYLNKVDGIILLSSFPCGPDSLTNEMCMRKIKIPIINIILDESTGESGLQTRIESFIDIINERKKVKEWTKE